MSNHKKSLQLGNAINRLFRTEQTRLPSFTRKSGEHPELFSVRPLDLPLDALTLHYWVNMPYSYNFWDMRGSTATTIETYYKEKMDAGLLYPFIISYGKLPIALIELYDVQKDALAQHISATVADKGIHTLMAPPRYLLTKLPQKIKQLSKEVLITALQFAFSFDGIDRIYTEPHIHNFHANELAKNMGFQFIKEIAFPNKKANLFCFEKQAFLEQYPNS